MTRFEVPLHIEAIVPEVRDPRCWLLSVLSLFFPDLSRSFPPLPRSPFPPLAPLLVAPTLTSQLLHFVPQPEARTPLYLFLLMRTS